MCVCVCVCVCVCLCVCVCACVCVCVCLIVCLIVCFNALRLASTETLAFQVSTNLSTFLGLKNLVLNFLTCSSTAMFSTTFLYEICVWHGKVTLSTLLSLATAQKLNQLERV